MAFIVTSPDEKNKSSAKKRDTSVSVEGAANYVSCHTEIEEGGLELRYRP